VRPKRIEEVADGSAAGKHYRCKLNTASQIFPVSKGKRWKIPAISESSAAALAAVRDQIAIRSKSEGLHQNFSVRSVLKKKP
jgi:hypothetical protein